MTKAQYWEKLRGVKMRWAMKLAFASFVLAFCLSGLVAMHSAEKSTGSPLLLGLSIACCGISAIAFFAYSLTRCNQHPKSLMCSFPFKVVFVLSAAGAALPVSLLVRHILPTIPPLLCPVALCAGFYIVLWLVFWASYLLIFLLMLLCLAVYLLRDYCKHHKAK